MSARTLRPELSPAARRLLLHEGVERFNAGRYFDAHESFEEVWRSTTPEPRALWQGIIQIAAGFYHYFARHRPDVARRVLAKGRRRLEALDAIDRGLAVAALIETVALWEAWLEKAEGAPPAPPRLRVVSRERLS